MSEPVFTNLQVTPLKNQESNIKASGQVVVANVMSVRFTIAEGRNGLWVKLPQHTFKAKNRETGVEETKWAKDVRIVDDDLYKQLTDMVLSEFRSKQNNAGNVAPAQDDKKF